MTVKKIYRQHYSYFIMNVTRGKLIVPKNHVNFFTIFKEIEIKTNINAQNMKTINVRTGPFFCIKLISIFLYSRYKDMYIHKHTFLFI